MAPDAVAAAAVGCRQLCQALALPLQPARLCGLKRGSTVSFRPAVPWKRLGASPGPGGSGAGNPASGITIGR